jgi:hypothetical protein
MNEQDEPIARERWDEPTIKMLLNLPESMWLALHRIARREQESASAVARRAIRLYVATDRAVEDHFFGPLNNEEE